MVMSRSLYKSVYLNNFFTVRNSICMSPVRHCIRRLSSDNPFLVGQNLSSLNLPLEKPEDLVPFIPALCFQDSPTTVATFIGPMQYEPEFPYGLFHEVFNDRAIFLLAVEYWSPLFSYETKLPLLNADGTQKQGHMLRGLVFQRGTLRDFEPQYYLKHKDSVQEPELKAALQFYTFDLSSSKGVFPPELFEMAEIILSFAPDIRSIRLHHEGVDRSDYVMELFTKPKVKRKPLPL